MLQLQNQESRQTKFEEWAKTVSERENLGVTVLKD